MAQHNSDAAAELLQHLVRSEPTSASAREALARALFDSKRFQEAADEFEELLELSPDNDYAHFGMGMSLWRLREFPKAADHLALARVMKPQDEAYSRALQQVRATLRSREAAGLPLTGDLPAERPESEGDER